jgi:curli biogenesis system outer membrane secretion channel CsgG
MVARSGMMSRSLSYASIIATLTLSSAGRAQSAPATLVTPRLRVGVMDLTGSALKMQTAQMAGAMGAPGMPPGMPGGVVQTSQTTIAIPPPTEFARALTEALTTSLVATGRFIVLERQALAQVQQEQDLGASGRVNKETAAEVGKLMGAQVLVTGDITSFNFKRSAIGGKLTNVFKGVDAGVERVTASVSIDLRLIDAVTGEIIASIKGDGDAAQQGITTELTKDEKKYDGSVQLTTPLGKASRQAIENSVAGILGNIPKMKWSARVIDFRGGVVYVNAGTGYGMKPGTALEIFDPQPALLDPETGRNLGSPDKLIGEVVIEQVEAQYSTAKVVSGSEFKRNQVVRLKGQGAKP